MFKYGVPGYLRKILDDYLDNRILLYDKDGGVQRYACGMTCTTDYLIIQVVTEWVTIAGYAHDVILVVVDKQITTVERRYCE